MKNIALLKKLLALLPFAILLTLMACEGPAGAPGADGKDGADGTDGTDGTDASESCRVCHNNSSLIATKSLQLNLSIHVSGEAWEEGTRNSCAPCHSSAGFLDVIANNPAKNKYVASASALTDPTPLTCRSCHKIHTDYAESDFDFTTVAGVDMLIDTTKTLTLDVGESSNLCVKCHQPRIVKQMDFAGAPTTTYSGITSYRWGTHYGTQGAIFGGKGGFEFTGTESYTNSSHTAATSCADCHMAAASGKTGGHTFSILNEETSAINTNGCTTCHTNSTTLNTNITTVKTEITTLLNELGAKLDDYLEKEDGVYTGYVDIYDATSNSNARYKNPNNGNVAFPTVNNKTAAALANFMLVKRDRSLGIHNYNYTKALLTNSIAAL